MFILLLIVLLLIVLLLVGVVGISWYISNKVLHRTPTSRALTIPITNPNSETVTLKKTSNTQRPGVFGLTTLDGQAIVGSIVSTEAETVTRQIIYSSTEMLSGKGAWNTTVYSGTGALRDQLNLTIQEVLIPGALGDMPAWVVPGKLDSWVILVHGASGTREQGLRFFRTLTELGFPILDITYRGDADAPASSDGLTILAIQSGRIWKQALNMH